MALTRSIAKEHKQLLKEQLGFGGYTIGELYPRRTRRATAVNWLLAHLAERGEPCPRRGRCRRCGRRRRIRWRAIPVICPWAEGPQGWIVTGVPRAVCSNSQRAWGLGTRTQPWLRGTPKL